MPSLRLFRSHASALKRQAPWTTKPFVVSKWKANRINTHTTHRSYIASIRSGIINNNNNNYNNSTNTSTKTNQIYFSPILSFFLSRTHNLDSQPICAGAQYHTYTQIDKQILKFVHKFSFRKWFVIVMVFLCEYFRYTSGYESIERLCRCYHYYYCYYYWCYYYWCCWCYGCRICEQKCVIALQTIRNENRCGHVNYENSIADKTIYFLRRDEKRRDDTRYERINCCEHVCVCVCACQRIQNLAQHAKSA